MTYLEEEVWTLFDRITRLEEHHHLDDSVERFSSSYVSAILRNKNNTYVNDSHRHDIHTHDIEGTTETMPNTTNAITHYNTMKDAPWYYKDPLLPSPSYSYY